MTPPPATRVQSFPSLGPLLDDDQPKPLYRDEVPPVSPRPPTGAVSGPDETSVRPITFAPRRPPSFDDETTILPRSRSTARAASSREVFDDFDDEEHKSAHPRARLALLIGAVAAVIVIGLAVGYAVIGIGKNPQANPGPTATTGGSAPGSTQEPPPGTATTEVITDALLLNPAQAATLDPKRTWTVERTQRGPAEDTPVPACFGGDPAEGEPTADAEVTQLLGSSGKSAPVVLHQASAYATPEAATQAFVVAAKTLGSCPTAGSYIASGSTVSGVGDQSVGAVIHSVDGSKTQMHTVVISRSGRVVNILDAAQPKEPITVTKVAKTLAAITATQCEATGGACGGKASVKAGPPPLGGDEPGYLALGDLPPAGSQVSPWVADSIGLPKEDFLGSGCEGVFWTTLDAEDKSSRIYLYQDSGDAFFGVNEIVLTMKDDQAATKLAEKIKSNIAECKKRKLTATVSKPAKVSSTGAEDSAVTGWTSTITQKSTKGPQKYRVGIVATGPKVVYTFLNPKGEFDFTDEQWDAVALRAGERATQVN